MKVIVKIEGLVVGEKKATYEEIRKMQNNGFTVIPVK